MKTIITFLLVTFLCSCYVPSHARMYPGPPLARGEVAIIVQSPNREITYDLDGTRPPGLGIVEVLSGRHILTLSAISFGRALDIPFEAVGGHTYLYYVTDKGIPQVDDITDHLADPAWANVKSAIDE